MPNKRPAQALVYRAIESGKLPKLDGRIVCVDCGAPARCYDHRDYAKPLEVEPVCQKCNKRRGPAKAMPDTGLNQAAVALGKRGGSVTAKRYDHEHFVRIGKMHKQLPDSEVTANALYMREYRKRRTFSASLESVTSKD